MTTWGLVLETTMGAGEGKRTEARVLAHISGTRAEALAELERRARGYAPEHPRSPRRRRLFRDGDGFLLVVEGALQSFATRFTVAELLEDSAAGSAQAPGGAAGAPDGAGEQGERYADGVPVRPAWLGRDDLP